MKYKAFISYSHAVDAQLAPALQSALYSFAKPWYRLRSMRVFRDQTTLSVTPELWGSIERGLSESEYFLLFASPGSAGSEWVGREVEWWLERRPIDRLFILLTDGELDWSDRDGDFDWTRTDALPRTLKGRFTAEPLWVDLRWARDQDSCSLRHPRFRAAILDLSASLLGRAKDDLDGEDVRQHHRVRRIAWSVVAALAILLVTASIAAFYATQQRDQARRQEALATEREREVRRTLAAADFSRGNSLLESGAAADALAYLARSIRTDTTSHDAANLLTSVLLTRSFPVLVADASRHDGETVSAMFSPDGRSILTAQGDSAYIWDASSGAPVRDPLRHDFALNGAEFSPDGRSVLTFGDQAVLWDVGTGRIVAVARDGRPVTAGESAEEATARLSPDGSRIVFDAGGVLRVHETRTGARIGNPLAAETTSLAFSPDGRTVLFGQSNGNLVLWDPANGKHRQLAGGAGEQRPVASSGNSSAYSLDRSISSARFSPNGSRIVTTAGHAAQLWNTVAGKPLGPPLQHDYVVQDALFSPDGTRVLTASFDGTTRLWDVATGAALAEPMTHAFAQTGEFSPDGLRVLTVPYEETTVRLWNALTGAVLLEPLRHEAAASAGTFSPDGGSVLTTSDDGQARVWDVRPRSALQLVLAHHAEATAADVSVDGRLVVSGAADNVARLWDALTGEAVGAPMPHSQARASQLPNAPATTTDPEFINFALFSPNGAVVFTSSTDGTARFWNAKTGAPLAAPLPVPGYATHASFSTDGKMVLFAADQSVWLLSAATGQALGEPIELSGPSIETAALSHDSRRAAAATGMSVFVWEVSTGRRLYESTHGHGGVSWMEFSPDGKVLVTAGEDGLVRFWDAASGRDLGRTLKHSETVLSARFNADGSRLVTASWDKTARIWDPATGAPVGAPMRHANYVGSAEFSGDGTRIITVSGGGTENEGRVWSAISGQPVSEPIPAAHAEAIRFVGVNGERLLLVPEGGLVVALQDLPVVSARDEAIDVAHLADLAEAVGGWKLVPSGGGERLVMMSADERRVILNRLVTAVDAAGTDPRTSLRRFLDWYLADLAVRTISPLTTLTMPQWVSRQASEGTLASVRESMRRDWNNPAVNARLGTLLAELSAITPALPEAARSRQEADFFRRRARQLAAANEAVRPGLVDEVLTTGSRPQSP